MTFNIQYIEPFLIILEMEPYPFPSPGSSHFTKSLSWMKLGEKQLKGNFLPLRGKDKGSSSDSNSTGLFLYPFSTETAETGPFLQVPLSKRG